VIVDLSGDALACALRGGLYLAKISHEALVADGWAASVDEDGLNAGMWAVQRAGARNVVVSRAEAPALALLDGTAVQVRQPRVTPVDPRGAGDAMTGALGAGLARGMTPAEAIRLGAAAGALNTTRRGLASGNRDQIEQLSERVELAPLPPRTGRAAAHPDAGTEEPEARR
jgi:1-phosphofructokinase